MKIALVTGASSGIGLGITHALLARDYGVVATSRTASKTLATNDRLRVVDGDVGDPRTAERAVLAAGELGGLDLLVNNAGIFIAKPFAEYSPDDYARLVNTNFAGFVRMTQAALGVMKGPGHIVNISTTLAVQPNVAVPSALPVLIKGGIEAATRALATELAAREIRVNAIAPGIVDTPMHTRESHDFLRKLTPGGRIAAVSDIAEALLYLEGARFVSGEILHVDGGAHAGKWS